MVAAGVASSSGLADRAAVTSTVAGPVPLLQPFEISMSMFLTGDARHRGGR
jgi:hypothetical protein